MRKFLSILFCVILLISLNASNNSVIDKSMSYFDTGTKGNNSTKDCENDSNTDIAESDSEDFYKNNDDDYSEAINNSVDDNIYQAPSSYQFKSYQIEGSLLSFINQVLTEMNHTDSYCESAPQQYQNGIFCSLQMAMIVAIELNDDTYSTQIENIVSLQDSLNGESAVQEAVISSYRIVEMLKIIAYEIDLNDTYTMFINEIEDKMNVQNEYCESAPQQLANGLYRIVEMLTIIATMLDDGSYSTDIQNITNDFDLEETYCESAPQQSANGSYRAAELLAIIAKELDYDSLYTYDIDSKLVHMNTQDTYCDSAEQQIANGTYRMTELFGIIATILDS